MTKKKKNVMGEHNTTEKKGAKRQIRNRKGIEQNKIVHKHKGTNQPLRIRVFFSLRLVRSNFYDSASI